MVLRKDELEVQLKDEHQLIRDGVLKDDSPLDLSDEFSILCDACRRGDLKACQGAITNGVNINARDSFDYTPLILASLCGHFEVVQVLLEAGALCERDTFQGERCLYNALNNRIRNLLLQYDYSKSTDPLQPLASHITSLLTRRTPSTSDITLTAAFESFHLHKFVLSARSPYFHTKLSSTPETSIWKLAPTVPDEAFHVALRYLYLGEVPADLGIGPKSFVTDEDVFKGIDKISKQLEIETLWEAILGGSDRRIARQRHQDEIARGRDQLEVWYRENVLQHKIEVETNKANDVKWSRDSAIFADVLLRVDGEIADVENDDSPVAAEINNKLNGIPIGPRDIQEASKPEKSRKSILYPAHRAMLIRSEYFLTMFSSQFQEAQVGDYLQVVAVDCTPAVLEVVLTFLYTEKAEIPLEIALDVLFVADMLFIEKLKTKAAVVISTLGDGRASALVDKTHTESNKEEIESEPEPEPINVYDVIRAAWLLRVQRLEEFAARYLANRLEDYIDEPEFEELIQESASRIQKRQETDTIELLDDIRYYLSERFRLRFEDSGLEEMMDENGELSAEAAQAISDAAAPTSEKLIATDEAIDLSGLHALGSPSPEPEPDSSLDPFNNGQIRTLDGEIAGDEFASDAINYQVLLRKIDALLERLKLDA